MIADPKSQSLKERIESQIITELVADKFLRAILPKKQNEDAKIKLPRLSVVATVGKEISPGAGLWNSSVQVEVHFKYPSDNAQILDQIVNRINAQIATAQSRGTYGIIQDGEQPTQFVSDTIRKRVVAFRVLAG